MPTPTRLTAQPELTLRQLRNDLDALVQLCDQVAANLEAERELADRRGDSRQVSGLQQGLLQVARVRNDVRTACRDLDAITSSVLRPSHPAAA